MEEARKKPKILLLRSPAAPSPEGESADPWARLIKALKTFTDLEDRELSTLPSGSLAPLTQSHDFLFLDSALAPWAELESAPLGFPLCLVQTNAFSWFAPAPRPERVEALTRIPVLLLEELTPPDLLRVLHLFLMPKRLAGVTPLMEKGSLVLGEKLMEAGTVGSLLDRIVSFLERLEGFALPERLADLRQVLSGLLLEGLRMGREKGVHYPYVDFQVSPADHKLALNLRFPRGQSTLGDLTRGALGGGNLFWQQIWQCSDVLLLTHHRAHDEIEVMVLLTRAERTQGGQFRTILHKTSDVAARREDLLTAPANYRFLLVSEINAKGAEELEVFTAEAPPAADEALGDIPEQAANRIRQLAEQARVLSDHVRRKDEQIQELMKKSQLLSQDLNSRRSELLRLSVGRDTQSDASEKRIRELEETLAKAQVANDPRTHVRDQQAAGALHDVVSRLEGTLRAAENEKTQLKESVAHEQRRVGLLEQKYSALYKDISAKEREILELKGGLNKLRKEADRPRAPGSDERREAPGARLKELEEREVTFKQEVKRLAFKVENMEKTAKAQQNEVAEKQKLFEQKLKIAKTREVDLLRRIEELTNSLKKIANKAA